MLSDSEIMTLQGLYNILTPFEDKTVRERYCEWKKGNIKCLSYGLSSYGYDLRMAPELHIFKPRNSDFDFIDPKVFDTDLLDKKSNMDRDIRGAFILPAKNAGLTRSFEHIKMPANVSALCIGKSTYARCGLIVNATPIEAGWGGHLTIELFNTTNHDLLLYPMEGIAQILLFQGNECLNDYTLRNGNYQYQTGITHAKV